MEPETLVAALFASAAISTYVLPTRIGAGVYADGGWVRNFPLAYAYREPSVKRIWAVVTALPRRGRRPLLALQLLHRRMSRLDRLRVARGVTTELREAIERHERGEPMHLVDTIARLSHIAVYRTQRAPRCNWPTSEIRSLQALQDVREHMREAIASSTRGSRRTELLASLDEAFASADFPFSRSRVVPRLGVDVSPPPGVQVDISRRRETWSDEEKRALIAHGRRLTVEALDGWRDERPRALLVPRPRRRAGAGGLAPARLPVSRPCRGEPAPSIPSG